MRLQVAGPAAERLDIVPFVPNEIRYLASDVIDKCVMGSVVPGIEPGTQGGFASKGLSNAIDYLINPDSNIAGPSEWRESLLWECNRSLTDRLTLQSPAQNTSFFTLMIWDERSPDWSFNPGNADPLLGYEILDELAFAIDDAEEGSLAEQELRSRYDFFDRAVSHMRRSVENNVWWQDWPAQPSLSLTDATSACNGKSPGLAYSNCSRLL